MKILLLVLAFASLAFAGVATGVAHTGFPLETDRSFVTEQQAAVDAEHAKLEALGKKGRMPGDADYDAEARVVEGKIAQLESATAIARDHRDQSERWQMLGLCGGGAGVLLLVAGLAARKKRPTPQPMQLA